MISHRSNACRAIFLAAVFLAALLPLAAAAQETRATVTGIVTDTLGAVIPGVTVTVLNLDTNVPTDAVTNDAGAYTARQLQPGPCRITASLQGFRTFVREGITLRTAETVTVNIQLAVGVIEETITVSAASSQIESNESTFGQVIEGKRITELPLNGRQVYMLLPLTSGTLFTQTTFGATGFSGTRAWDVNGSLTIHGSRTGNNEFLIDGAPSAGTGGGTGSWNYAPPVDAIQEFRVQTASVDASYGRTSGGIVNMTLRSGTNQLRGSGVLLHRGTWLDANQIQNIRNRISNEGHKYYNGETMASGPIRRSKTFFMGGYQGFFENIPFPATRTVPTDLQLQGDFSRTFNAAGQLIQIFDPATTTCNAQGQCARQPFLGNRIPADRIHPIAKALLQYFPRANAQGSTTGQANFISSPNLGRYRYNSYLTRIDHVFGDRHRMSVSHSANWGIEYRNENALPEPTIRSDNYPTHRNHYLVTVDDTVTLSTSAVWNTRFSFDRFNEPHDKQYGDVTPTLPFTGKYQLTGPPFPQINFDFYEDMFPRTFRRVKNDAYALHSVLSKTTGNHLLKLGGEYRAYNFFRVDEVASNGIFEFNENFTRRNPFQGDGTSGNSFASFLLGLPAGNLNSRVATGTPRTEQYRYYAGYVQDDWKISQRATLNVGLRWDYQAPIREANDNIVARFDRTSPNPLQAQLPAGTINPATGQPLDLKGGLVFARQGGPKSPYKGDWNNVQPRVSFSYQISQRLIARSNYGRSYLGLSSGGQAGGYFQDFQRDTPFVASIDGGLTPFQPWANPFPDGFLQPRAGELGLATFLGQNLNPVPNPDYTIPYSDQWMAGVDIELPGKVSLDVAYVGNKVSELGVTRNLNVIPQSEREKGIARLGGTPTYLTAQLPNPFAGRVPGTGINASTVARSQLLRPFPQFGGTINMNRLNLGWQKYHALEAVATKRYSDGVMVAVNYTLMNLRVATDRQNDYDPGPFEDYSADMRRHRLTIVALWDLPFGPGRAIGGGANGFAATLVGGWQVNVIGELQSGRPIGMNANAIPRQESFAIDNQSFSKWFDNSTRTNPRPDGGYAWDTVGTNDYRQSRFRFPDVTEPVEPHWALSLFKNTRIGARVNMQIRVETFNLFNVRQYGAPNTDPNNPTFGVVNTASQVNFARTTQLGLRFSF